jgi:hypothetical protein
MGQLRHFRFLIGLLQAICLLVLLSPQAGAQSTLEKLLMPGPLSSAHAKLEQNCDNCHVAFSKKSQDKLCLTCHKEIQADRIASMGFHGRSPLMSGLECNNCHTEHKGRDASIIQLSTETFSHDQTDFPLLGSHRQIDCIGCHLKGKKFSEAPSTCFGCHDKTQPHKGNLGNKCETCHQVSKWTVVAAFDHSKTAFPLQGKHASVPCANCHLGEVYKDLPSTCNDCHAIQDVHVGRFGNKCESCHKVESWKEAKFDHAKNTRFALNGAHATAACQDCHHQDFTTKLSMACFDCHQKQDVHKATLGKNCADCHSEVAWRSKVKFDHGLTNYPLIGQHVAVACEGCHASAVFREAKMECVDCHKSDDVHRGRFAVACADCHSPNGWQRVKFDHSQTSFALTGTHARVGCYNCHSRENVASAKLPTTCYSCHKAQDVHRGAFGQNCARCHTTATFKSAFIRQ